MVLDGEARGGAARIDTELCTERVEMGSHGTVADYQLPCDLLLILRTSMRKTVTVVGKGG